MDFKKELNFHTYLSDSHTENHMQKKEWIPDITSQLKEGYQRFFSANTPGIKDPFPFHCIFMPPIFCISAQNTVCSLIQLTFFFYNYTVLLFVTVYQKNIFVNLFPFSPAFCVCTSISSFLPLPTCLPLPPLVHLYLQTGLPPASLLCKSDRQE